MVAFNDSCLPCSLMKVFPPLELKLRDLIFQNPGRMPPPPLCRIRYRPHSTTVKLCSWCL